MSAKWYALHVTTGAEADVRERLNRLAYPSMLPRKVMRERSGGQWRDVLRVMLPGYVFAEVGCPGPPSQGMRAADWHRIRHLPGVLRILGDGVPTPLTEEEARRVAWLDNGGEPWAVSEARGDRLKYQIISGPLLECPGEIVSVDPRQNRARIAASILGENKFIDLALIFEDRQPANPEG